MRKLYVLLSAILWGFLLSAQNNGGAFYEIDEVAEIHIYFDHPDWMNMLDSLKSAGHDDRLTGDVVVNGKRYEEVGIRYKGNSSFNSVSKEGEAKLPLNIKLDYKDKSQALPGGFETLKLSNVFRDPSFLREVLSYEIARQYMPAPRANFAKVYVNDQYLGFYNSTESVDKKFLLNHYGNCTGTLVKCDPNWDFPEQEQCPTGDHASLEYLGEDSICYMGLYEMKSDYGWKDLISLTYRLNEEPDSLEQWLDVDQVLWMLAFNNVLVNLDSYSGMLCHNYYLYRDTFGMFHPIVWDMNLSFGAFRYPEKGSSLSNQEMQELSPFLHYRNDKRPLIHRLLSNSLYRKIYLAHIRTMLEENFSNGKYLEKARAIQETIAPLVESDTNRLYRFETFRQNLDTTTRIDNQAIIGIAELMEKRTEYLRQHPLISKAPPVISAVQHEKSKDRVRVSATVQKAERVWLCYRYAGQGNFKRIEMAGTGGDSEQAMIWEAMVDKHPGMQYYVTAEGERTAALSPERASLEFYEVDEPVTKKD